MAAVKIRTPVEYLRVVTADAVTYGKKSEPVLDLTDAIRVTPNEWAWCAAIVAATLYVAGSVVHTTLTIIQGLLS